MSLILDSNGTAAIMKLSFLLKFVTFISFSFPLFLHSGLSKTIHGKGLHRAILPPRGWNSYDSFSWTVSEREFLHNAQIISQILRPHGYEYVVVDYLWYRRKVEGACSESLGLDVIDEWGRLVPDPGRWPSSNGGKGFSKVANKVHSLGLKFGIHVMRGVSTQVFNENTPIPDTKTGGAYEEAGRVWHAKDIAIKERACEWMPQGFMSVNTKLGAGRAFLRSLYEQYAAWGVDLVKNDCVFGDDLDVDEISYVSEVLKELSRPILYSISPGTSVTPAMAKEVSRLVNMYRITGDDWDSWEDVAAHFNVTRDFSAAKMIGAEGLLGRSWPDLDMLPLGWLTDAGSNEGPHRQCGLNIEEQKTQMTLWSMAKSPLMFGGDVRKLDQTTYDLITNPVLLEINAFSSNNMEFPHVTSVMSLKNETSHHDAQTSDTRKLSLGLMSCTDSDAMGWGSEPFERVCWKRKSENKQQAPFCLHKKKPSLPSDNETVHKQEYRGEHHVLETDKGEFCLIASPKEKLTSKETSRGSYHLVNGMQIRFVPSSSCNWFGRFAEKSDIYHLEFSRKELIYFRIISQACSK